MSVFFIHLRVPNIALLFKIDFYDCFTGVGVSCSSDDEYLIRRLGENEGVFDTSMNFKLGIKTDLLLINSINFIK